MCPSKSCPRSRSPAGTPVALAVVQQPSSETLNNEILNDQPVVELRDSADNPVVNPEVVGLKVRAHLLPGHVFMETAMFGDKVFTFRFAVPVPVCVRSLAL